MKVRPLRSSTLSLSAGSPQGYVLSPFLYTHVCVPSHHSNIAVQLADEATVVGLITGGDETAYRGEVQTLEALCSTNNLMLKTKEMVIDFRSEGILILIGDLSVYGSMIYV